MPRESASLDHLAAEKGQQPTPSQEFVAKEQWERAIRGRTKLQIEILSMLRDGHSQVEIARTLGLTEKMVQRLVRKISERLNS